MHAAYPVSELAWPGGQALGWHSRRKDAGSTPPLRLTVPFKNGVTDTREVLISELLGGGGSFPSAPFLFFHSYVTYDAFAAAARG